MKNRQPSGDVWKLPDMDPDSQNYGKTYRVDFSYIGSLELKSVFKDYIWDNYRIANRTTYALHYEVIKFRKFIKFAGKNSIRNFREMTNDDVSRFISFLHTKVSEVTGAGYSYSYQKNCLNTLKAVVHWCQIHKPDAVPLAEIFTGNEYRGLTNRIKIEFIPDDIMVLINSALKTERNFYVRYGIIVLKATGMRIGDLMNLKVDCVKPHPVSGYTMAWYDHKNRKEHPPLPIPKECAVAVSLLAEQTKSIRLSADEDIRHHLFIHVPQKGKRKGNPTNITTETFHGWLRNFIEQNSILDSDGNSYRLTAHKFRRTLATDMFSKDVSLKVIQEVLGHSSPMVTKRHYADVKTKEYAEIFDLIGIIGDISQIDGGTIPDPAELQWFRNNKDSKARMCDGYCTQPFLDGQICERLLNRQKCYTCSRYITTPKFLETHKTHLRELEQQLEQNIYGEHYAAHFKPVIKILKDIVGRLEAMQQ